MAKHLCLHLCQNFSSLVLKFWAEKIVVEGCAGHCRIFHSFLASTHWTPVVHILTPVLCQQCLQTLSDGAYDSSHSWLRTIYLLSSCLFLLFVDILCNWFKYRDSKYEKGTRNKPNLKERRLCDTPWNLIWWGYFVKFHLDSRTRPKKG